MNGKEKLDLQAAVFRQTAKEPEWLGYWLARHQQSEDLDEQELAARLGVAMDKLVLLCLCRTRAGPVSGGPHHYLPPHRSFKSGARPDTAP